MLGRYAKTWSLDCLKSERIVRGFADYLVTSKAHLGYGGIPLCEDYLRTGDAAALPVIRKWAESARKAEYLDAWAGRGGVTPVSYGNGHLLAQRPRGAGS